MPESAPQTLSPVAAIARAQDPDRFLCALFAPAPRREALFALIAYNHELARARAAARTPLIALMRLQWWRDAVEDAAAGRPARRHEVAAPLHAAIAAGLLDASALLAMADAREAEAEEEGLPSQAAFAAYLRGTAGGFALAAGRLLGVAEGAMLAALQEAGALYGLAGVLRSVPALARDGRCLLPLEALEAEGLTPEAVVVAPTAPPVSAVICALAVAGRDRVPAAAAALRPLPRAALAAALPLVLARRDLRRLALGGAATGAAPRGLGDRLAITLAALRGRA
jgi:phytoene synthase